MNLLFLRVAGEVPEKAVEPVRARAEPSREDFQRDLDENSGINL